jgi:hypothetical protein
MVMLCVVGVRWCAEEKAPGHAKMHKPRATIKVNEEILSLPPHCGNLRVIQELC